MSLVHITSLTARNCVPDRCFRQKYMEKGEMAETKEGMGQAYWLTQRWESSLHIRNAPFCCTSENAFKCSQLHWYWWYHTLSRTSWVAKSSCAACSIITEAEVFPISLMSRRQEKPEEQVRGANIWRE